MSHLDITTKQITDSVTIVIVIIASEDPSGQLFAFPNITWIRFATIIPSDPPTNLGVIKSPVVGMKIIMDAAKTPGNERGKVILQNRLKALSPKSAAASSRDLSIFSSDT
jgi:hypothetical protein